MPPPVNQGAVVSPEGGHHEYEMESAATSQRGTAFSQRKSEKLSLARKSLALVMRVPKPAFTSRRDAFNCSGKELLRITEAKAVSQGAPISARENL